MNKNIQNLIDKGLIMKANEVPLPEKIPTGSLMLDYILDGGLSTRRLSQFYGDEGCGKSVLSYHCINNALKMYQEKYALLVDLEHRVDVNWISNFVEDMDRLLIIQPEVIELVGNDIRKLINDEKIDFSIIVIDSIAAANTVRSYDKDMTVAQMGGSSMGIGIFVRALVPLLNKHNIAGVVINQVRESFDMYVANVEFPGGRALKHALDLNLYLRRTSEKAIIKDENGENYEVGRQVAFKIVKGKNQSKVIKTFFYKETSELGDLGFDRVSEVINLAIGTGVIEKSAMMYKHVDFPNGKIMGRDKTIEFLKSNPEIYEKIEKVLYENLKTDSTHITTEQDD